ncbi:MAG: pyridoxamine 5'-phosphate oxidase family protein [bacterium]|nr:pyridoxamine 5'-phosphate oxidase family protein [bacterium]
MEPVSDRIQVKRLPERGNYDRAAINEILDEALVCHVGIVTSDGYPMVIPTIHARQGNTLYIHGSAASRLLRSMRSGDEICVTVTLLDGLVVARSAVHNSMNYRSVVVLGSPRMVDDPDEKLAALEVVTDHVIPGRWAQSREVLEKEVKGTLVVALAIDEASAKVRTGPPVDDEADYSLPIWAGVVPLSMVAGDPIPDARNLEGIEAPVAVAAYER